MSTENMLNSNTLHGNPSETSLYQVNALSEKPNETLLMIPISIVAHSYRKIASRTHNITGGNQLGEL